MPPTSTFSCIWKYFFNAFRISLHCCAPPSFIMNCSRFLILRGINKTSANEKTHWNENLFWFGIHIHKNTTSFPTEVWHEKVSRSKPLLLEWELTSTQITSGYNINNCSAGKMTQAMAKTRS